MEVRRATMDDRNEIESLLAEVDKLHYSERPDIWRMPPAPDPRVPWLLEGDDRVVFLAEEDGAALGLIHMVEIESAARDILVPRRYAQLTVAVVRAGARGRGIGRSLFASAEAWARARDLGTIELNVAGFNADAIAVWEALGFTAQSHRMEMRLS